MQHLLRGGLKLAAFSSSVRVRGRCITQIWSCASTATPDACPMIQLLGSVFGHDGSTSKRGISAACVEATGKVTPSNAAAKAAEIMDLIVSSPDCRHTLLRCQLGAASSHDRYSVK